MQVRALAFVLGKKDTSVEVYACENDLLSDVGIARWLISEASICRKDVLFLGTFKGLSLNRILGKSLDMPTLLEYLS